MEKNQKKIRFLIPPPSLPTRLFDSQSAKDSGLLNNNPKDKGGTSLAHQNQESTLKREREIGFKTLASRQKRAKNDLIEKSQHNTQKKKVKGLNNHKDQKPQRIKKKKSKNQTSNQTETDLDLQKKKREKRKMKSIFVSLWRHPYSWAFIEPNLDPSFPKINYFSTFEQENNEKNDEYDQREKDGDFHENNFDAEEDGDFQDKNVGVQENDLPDNHSQTHKKSIKKRVSLNLVTIKRRLESGAYESIEGFLSEIFSMFDLCNQLNSSSLVICDLSNKLKAFTLQTAAKILGGDHPALPRDPLLQTKKDEASAGGGGELLNVFSRRLRTKLSSEKTRSSSSRTKLDNSVPTFDSDDSGDEGDISLPNSTETSISTLPSPSFDRLLVSPQADSHRNSNFDSFHESLLSPTKQMMNRKRQIDQDGPQTNKESDFDQEILKKGRRPKKNSFSLEELYESLDCLEAEAPTPPTLKNTLLYPYQKRSIYACWRREQYEEFIDLSHPTSFNGGLLCEEMGRGKTLICLGLILLTKGEPSCVPPQQPPFRFAQSISLPPPSPIFDLPISALFDQKRGVTSTIDTKANGLSSLTSPSEEDHIELFESAEFEKSIEEGVRGESKEGKTGKVSSLLSICCHYIRRKAMDIRDLPDELQVRIQQSGPLPFYYLHHQIPLSERIEPKPPTKVYLSYSNLIIVPSSILSQWMNEIETRIESGYLSVYSSQKELPKARDLLKYDIVLLTHTTLSREAGKSEIGQQSSLSQIRWRRVIVDEGHVVGQKAAKRVQFAATLQSESRWVVTGTPSPGSCIGAQLNNLQGLLSFLNCVPFDNSKFWSQNIKSPWLNGDIGAYEKLKTLLTRIMVRNSSVAILNDVQLPPLKIIERRLSMNYSEKRKYNELVGLIKTNLICSEFEGIDSFFHSMNRAHALRALENLSLACFYYSGIDTLEKYTCAKTINQYIHSKSTWTTSSQSTTVLDPNNPIGRKTGREMTSAMTTTQSAEHEAMNQSRIQMNPHFYRQLLEIKQLMEDPPTHLGFPSSDDSHLPSDIASRNPPNSNQPSENPSLQTESGQALLKRIEEIETQEKEIGTEREIQTQTEIEELLRGTKVKYLLERVKEEIHQDRDKKIIIFSQFHDSLRRLLDLFDYENVMWQKNQKETEKDEQFNDKDSEQPSLETCPFAFCEYHIKMTPTERAEAVVKFNSDPAIRLIIMQTDLAAYGINLTAASHIFIVDPIWDLSKERQAIKRAHRLGQTRAVTVEKLVIAHSIEEPILQIQADSNLNTPDRTSKLEYDRQQLRKVHRLLKSLNLVQ